MGGGLTKPPEPLPATWPTTTSGRPKVMGHRHRHRLRGRKRDTIFAGNRITNDTPNNVSQNFAPSKRGANKNIERSSRQRVKTATHVVACFSCQQWNQY